MDYSPKSFLGDLGTRLQRVLGFDGPSPVSYDGKAIPVIIVGDGTMPGYGEAQGRRFNVFNGLTTGNSFYLRATADVIINRLDIQWTAPAAGTVTLQLVAPGVADPGGTSPAIGVYLDRNISNTDRPPMVGSSNAAGGGIGANIGNFFCAAGTIAGTVVAFGTPFLLGAGQALTFNCAGPSGSVMVWGQTL